MRATASSSIGSIKNREDDAVEQYADALGTTPDELFQELESVEFSEESSENCLSPEDVRLYSIQQLSWDKTQHVFDCADCRALTNGGVRSVRKKGSGVPKRGGSSVWSEDCAVIQVAIVVGTRGRASTFDARFGRECAVTGRKLI